MTTFTCHALHISKTFSNFAQKIKRSLNQSVKLMEIKSTLKKHGYNLSDVAKALGISTSALSQQIANDTLTIKRLKKIADTTGIPMEVLTAGDAIDEVRTSIDEAFACIEKKIKKYEKQREENLADNPYR